MEEQLEAWRNDLKTQESVLFNLGGCSADGMEHAPLFDGKFFHQKGSNVSVQFHVSDKEINAIDGIEADGN